MEGSSVRLGYSRNVHTVCYCAWMSLVAGLLRPKLFSSKLSKAEAGTIVHVRRKELYRKTTPPTSQIWCRHWRKMKNSWKNQLRQSVTLVSMTCFILWRRGGDWSWPYRGYLPVRPSGSPISNNRYKIWELLKGPVMGGGGLPRGSYRLTTARLFPIRRGVGAIKFQQLWRQLN